MFKENIYFLCVACLLFWCVTLLSCSQINQVSTISDKDTGEKESAYPSSQDLNLGPGDELEIRVWKQSDLDRTVRIDEKGKFFFPLAGRILARGKSIEQVRQILNSRLKEYFVKPQVSIYPTSLSSRQVFVLGEVNTPGVQTLDSGTTAIEAIASAGGFTNDANRKSVMVLRQAKDTIEAKAFNMDFQVGLAKNYRSFYLQNKDILYVAPKKIASWERFIQRLGNMISPFVNLERGIVLGPDVKDILLHGKIEDEGRDRVIVAP